MNQPRARRLVSSVYDARAGGRSVFLDGPWWLALTVAAALAVLIFGSSPWRWFALPIVVALFWLPLSVRWVVALARSVRAFREGIRDQPAPHPDTTHASALTDPPTR